MADYFIDRQIERTLSFGDDWKINSQLNGWDGHIPDVQMLQNKMLISKVLSNIEEAKEDDNF